MYPQIRPYQLFICVRSSGNCHVISFWGTLQDGGQNISFQRVAKVVKSENTQVKIGNSLFKQVGIVDYVVAIRCDRG